MEEKRFFTITYFPEKQSRILSGYNVWANNMLEALELHYQKHPGIEPHYIHYKPEIKE